MKKFIVISAIIGMLSSCNNEVENQIDGIVPQQEKTAKELLQVINKENPLSSVGISHNMYVEKFHQSLKGKTRSTGLANMTPTEMGDSLKAYAMQEIADAIDKYGETHYTLVNYSSEFDSIIAPISQVNPKTIKLVTKEVKAKATQMQIGYLNELEAILKKKGSNLNTVLSMIYALQKKATTGINSGNNTIIDMACSVAANSCYYWEENLPIYCADWNISVSEVDWQDVGLADVNSAIQSVISGGIVAIAAKVAFSWEGVAVSAGVGSAWNLGTQLWNQYQNETH